ncbi:MAG TPA: thiamine phosphate synthase [Planctomicrobium sp.]|nr:thiamine phosphate synthase [Planctomicrobium sp.]
MAFLHLTAGAERVLTRLRQEFSSEETSLLFTWRLLQELLEDEGHAAEILRHADIDSQALRQQLEHAPTGNMVAIIDWQRALVRRADCLAIDSTDDGVTGTEHLLLALIDQEPMVARFFLEYEITRDAIWQTLEETPPELEIPDGALVQIRPAGQGTVDAASIARIMDASANRCREGLRVIEDYVRFHLDDAMLQRELKQIRHQLTQTLRHLGQERWVPARDSLRDVGPQGTLATERSRASLTDVVRANFKRVEESLRSLEEYGKLIDSEPALRISECRYRIYTVEKMMETLLLNRQRLESCHLYLLVTAAGCRYSPEIVIRNSLEKGVDVIQVREKEMPDRELLDYCRKVREWTNEAKALLIINDRPDIAAAVGADGVHLGQDDLDVASARKILGGTGLIGVSTHTPDQARAAIFDGADYLGVGPVFTSQTKEFTEFAGLEYVQQASELLAVPWFAIGGITPQNLKQVLSAGARRVAVSSVICQSADPRGVTSELVERLRPAQVNGEGSVF